MSKVVTFLLTFCIRAYQVIVRPHLAGGCKFMPTCSDYAAEAVRTCGPWRGSALTVKRVCRCHPWGQGGWDPVPDRIVDCRMSIGD